MAFFDTLKNVGKSAIRSQAPILSAAYDVVKNKLQTPAQPTMPSITGSPANGAAPVLPPMTQPQGGPTTSSFGAPVMPQVVAPPTPTYTPSVNASSSFKSGLSQAQVGSLQTLASKPTDQWTATDKANWAYGTNNGALPSQAARPPLPEINSQSQGDGTTQPQEQPKPEAPQAPVLPPDATPETKKAVEASQALYEKSLQVSPEELSTQGDVDKLLESARKGFVNAQNQAIPMEFITGQLKSIEDRANALAEPLQTRLARLQAQRTSAITASKFALERADAKAADEKAQAEKARQEQAAISKPIEVGGSIVQLNPKTGKYDVLYEAPEKTTASTGFSLSPGESRYDASGKLIASSAAKPGSDTPDVQTINGQSSVYDTATGTFKPVNLQQGTSAEAAQKAKSVSTLASEILNDPSLNAAVGPLSSRLPTFSGNTANIEAKIKQLKSLLTLDNLGKGYLKGAISDRDLEVLSSAATSLSTNMGEAGFRKELSSIIQKMNASAPSSQGANDPLGLGFNQESQTSQKGPLASNRPNPTKVIQTSTGTYDFSTYATDPNWGNAVKSHISRIPQLNTSQDITSFIRSQAPNSPITGDMVIASARKFNVDPKLILAIAKQEANYATLGRAARTFNPGNVGNVDSGANVNWGSWQAGLDALARNVSRRITSNLA